MRTIAIETSGRSGSVAALIGEESRARQVKQIVLTDESRTAEALVPAIKELLSQVGWASQSVDLVTVATGPGSFTGLRIGVTTAKTLAYAVGAQIIGVNTLAAMARQAYCDDSPPAPLWTILDAQRRELFTAYLPAEQVADHAAEIAVSIMKQSQWLANLRPGDRVAGPPLKTLESQLPPGIVVVEESKWHPLADAVGEVGWRRYLNGVRDDPWTLLPQYYRASAAEEKLG